MFSFYSVNMQAWDKLGGFKQGCGGLEALFCKNACCSKLSFLFRVYEIHWLSFRILAFKMVKF